MPRVMWSPDGRSHDQECVKVRHRLSQPFDRFLFCPLLDRYVFLLPTPAFKRIANQMSCPSLTLCIRLTYAVTDKGQCGEGKILPRAQMKPVRVHQARRREESRSECPKSLHCLHLPPGGTVGKTWIGCCSRDLEK